jgi:hypothetical protein
MKERKEIWTVDLCNITTGESLFDHRCNCLCDDLDGAIEVAKEIISEYVDYPDVVETTVYQGQYMTENGDVLGEPYDVSTATNKSPQESADARQRADYVRKYVDYYAVDPQVDVKPTEFKGKQYKSTLIVSPFDDYDSDILVVSSDVQPFMLNEDGATVDEEAENFDNLVYCYCPDEWFSKTESKFVKLIKEYFD